MKWVRLVPTPDSVQPLPRPRRIGVSGLTRGLVAGGGRIRRAGSARRHTQLADRFEPPAFGRDGVQPVRHHAAPVGDGRSRLFSPG